MNCPQCGSEISANAKFCTNCGTRVQSTAESAAAAEAQPADQTAQTAHSETPAAPVNNSPSDVPPAAPIQQQANSQTGEKVKMIAKDYFSFLWDTLKAPSRIGTQVDASHKMHGLINMLILVLIVPLINLISALIHGASRLRPLDEMGLGFFIQDAVSDYYRRAVIDEFLLSILSTAISLVLVIVVLYITASLLKVESHFMTITTRFGVLMTVPTAIFIAGSLIMLIGVPTLGNIINACAMFATGLAIINTYRSLEVKESKLDPFHMYLIIVAICYLLHRIVEMIF